MHKILNGYAGASSCIHKNYTNICTLKPPIQFSRGLLELVRKQLGIFNANFFLFLLDIREINVYY